MNRCCSPGTRAKVSRSSRPTSAAPISWRYAQRVSRSLLRADCQLDGEREQRENICRADAGADILAYDEQFGRSVPACQRRKGGVLSLHHGRVRRREAAISPAVAPRRSPRRSPVAGGAPGIEEVNAALAQLTAWGNLESHPDTARVSSLGDLLPRALSLPAVAGRRSGRDRTRHLRPDASAPRRTADGGARGHRQPAAGASRARRRDRARRGQDPRNCCAISSACSKAWPRMRRPSWPASPAASSCSRPKRARSQTTSAG